MNIALALFYFTQTLGAFILLFKTSRALKTIFRLSNETNGFVMDVELSKEMGVVGLYGLITLVLGIISLVS